MLLVAFVQSATVPLVSAQEPTPRLPRMGAYMGPSDDMPYVAGYQEKESGWSKLYNTTKKVRITVSFPDTSPSVIPAGNYIAGGMFLQGQGGISRTDYGFVASLSLDSDGILQYKMGFYETFEGDWGVLQYYTIIWKKAEVLDGIDPSTPVTLTMMWYGWYVQWYYTIDGNEYLVYSYNVWGYESEIIPKFYIGRFYDPTFLIPASWEGFYYQFGIYSETKIENSGWTVRLYHPQYYTKDNRWKCVLEAKSVQGFWSYMDHWWKWGGHRYYGAWARYYGNGLAEGFAVEFYWAGGDGISGGVTLWNNPLADPERPERPRGQINPVKGNYYSYSTISVDPNDNDLMYTFYWGDGKSTETDYFPSGVTVSRSHSWPKTGYYTIQVKATDTTGRSSWLSYGLTVHVIQGCVAEGTLVTMADGSTKPVEDIKKGDQVLGYDPATGSFMVENVLDVTKTKVEVIVNINYGRLRLTPLDQPIFIRNSTHEGWVRDPATIQVGWEIYEAKTNGWVPVTSVTYEEGKARVYDLVLDGYTTYIANGILVMDKNGGGC